jgi:hypothetical protein
MKQLVQMCWIHGTLLVLGSVDIFFGFGVLNGWPTDLYS